MLAPHLAGHRRRTAPLRFDVAFGATVAYVKPAVEEADGASSTPPLAGSVGKISSAAAATCSESSWVVMSTL